MKHHETLKHSSFDATITALDAETSALGVTGNTHSRGVTGNIGAEFPAISAIVELV